MQRLTSTRMGTLILGGVTALVAGALLLVYVAQSARTRMEQSATVSVLVANQPDPAGTRAATWLRRQVVHGRRDAQEPGEGRRHHRPGIAQRQGRHP